ncbi:MAG: Bug family tripartite tricarboxylate transporter substrate binding protein, partial [Janthinobacterium lividum]
PFGGAGPAVQAVLGGTTPVACVALPPARPLVAAGSLVPLAVTGEKRWFDLPEVPTMVELGYPGFVADTFQAFLAPAKTPPGIVAALAKASVEILQDPKIAAQLHDAGLEVVASTPEAFAKRIASEIPKWRDVIAKAGIPQV